MFDMLDDIGVGLEGQGNLGTKSQLAINDLGLDSGN